MDVRNLTVTLVIGGIALLFIGFMWYQNSAGVDLEDVTPTETPTTTPNDQSSGTSTILLAMLDTEGTSTGPSRGCDKVVMVNQAIATTTAPLTAALEALFAIPTTSVQGWFNFIPNTSATLQFDHATVSAGTAHVYLTGSLSGVAGVCDDPRTEIQIEETALQFPTVQNVQLYLDNQPVSTLAPSMK